ncbi:MAG: hypothetical protein ISP86_04935 [Shewanellaceae bacterium]|nr:hypothetical protein [Shewanellaceae bacterium]
MDIMTYCNRELLNELPTFQRKHIKNLLKTRDETQAFDIWVNAYRASLQGALGSQQSHQTFEAWIASFLDELKHFVDDDPKYREAHTKLLNEQVHDKGTVLSIISTAISPYVKATPTMLAPMVAIRLLLLGKMSQHASC